MDDAKTPKLELKPDPCRQCGHEFNDHQLKGYGEPPVEGWIECPIEGCHCHKTWASAAGTAEGGEAAYQRYLNEMRSAG
jgi:hypothetical protein